MNPVVIVVHGESNIGLQLKMDTRSRCDRTYQLFLEHKTCVQYIICTGGLFEPNQQGVAVSLAMQDYLISLGVPKKMIVCETASRTTIENVELSKSLFDPNIHLLVVTSDYHLNRTKRSWLLQGGRNVDNLTMYPAPTPDLSPAKLPKGEKTLAQKRQVEKIGLIIVWLYWLHFRWPDELMRTKRSNSLKSI